MKTCIARRLQVRKRRSKQRLATANQDKYQRFAAGDGPVLDPPGVKCELAGKARGIGDGGVGLGLMVKLAREVGLVEALDRELQLLQRHAPNHESHDVRVNCVAPGLIETEMAHVLSEAQISRINEATPLGRLGKPAEVAELVCFLLGDRSSFTTGQCVVACGGRVTVP